MFDTRLLIRATAAIALSAALPAAFATSNPPAGMVAVNYNRCDGNYSGWELHLFQRGPGGPAVPGISWGSGLPQTGKTDFGVYWHAKLEDFPGGKVNYIIHRGDTKEQGGKDQQFDGNTVKEVWVNSGDTKMYTSLDEAKAGRAANPCK